MGQLVTESAEAPSLLPQGAQYLQRAEALASSRPSPSSPRHGNPDPNAGAEPVLETTASPQVGVTV